MNQTAESLRTVLELQDISIEHIYSLIKEGMQVESLTYEAKESVSDLSFLATQSKLISGERFLSMLRATRLS